MIYNNIFEEYATLLEEALVEYKRKYVYIHDNENVVIKNNYYLDEEEKTIVDSIEHENIKDDENTDIKVFVAKFLFSKLLKYDFESIKDKKHFDNKVDAIITEIKNEYYDIKGKKFSDDEESTDFMINFLLDSIREEKEKLNHKPLDVDFSKIELKI